MLVKFLAQNRSFFFVEGTIDVFYPQHRSWILTTKKNIKLLAFIRNVTFNPMILSILIGVLLFIFNINIDDTTVDYILSVLAACVSPVGLFAIGITLSFYTNKVINKLTSSISILKLVISPIILLIIGFIFFDAGVPE